MKETGILSNVKGIKYNSSSYLENDINQWLKSIKIRCKKSTYSNYQYMVEARIKPKFAKIKKKKITLDMINNYTIELLNEGLLPKTIKDILVLLQQILKFANVDIKIAMPKIPKQEIQILTREEQLYLEQQLLQSVDLIKFGIYFCLYTGLRIGEICALKWGNIDLENKKISIRNTIIRVKNSDGNSNRKTKIVIDEAKSKSSIREIPIPEFLITLLQRFSENMISTNYLITGNDSFLEPRSFLYKYKKILSNSHLDKYNFHALRHTFATRCIENGCDAKTVSEILGHSSVKITLERYVHPNYERKVQMMNQLKPMF